jgi:hypothetical protein
MATVKRMLSIGDAIPHATLQPTLVKVDGTNFPVWGYSFATGAVNQQISWRFKASNYGSGNLTLLLDIYSSGTTGSPVFGAAISALTPGDAQSMLTDALATETTGTVAINSTANGPQRISITISNLDSLAADDTVELRLRRTDNSVAAAVVVVGVELQYSDT